MEKISYKQFMEMTEEEWEQIPDEALPEVPKELLHNSIVESKAERRDGQIGFLSTQEVKNGKNSLWMPVYKVKTLSENLTVLYKLDPTTGLYQPKMETEPSLEEQPIGKYGKAWMNFMEEHHPMEAVWLKFQHQWLTVARSVEKSAMNYRELLEAQYERENPRPQTSSYEELLGYHRTMDFYVDSAVMREKVLVLILTP